MSRLFINREEIIDIHEIPDMSIEEIVELLRVFDKKVENKKSVKIALQLVLKTMLRFITDEPVDSPVKNRMVRLVNEVYLLSTKLNAESDESDFSDKTPKSDYELVEENIINLLKVKQTEHLCMYAYKLDIRSIYYIKLDKIVHVEFFYELMKINPIGVLFLDEVDEKILALALTVDEELEHCLRKVYGDSATNKALFMKSKLLKNYNKRNNNNQGG